MWTRATSNWKAIEGTFAGSPPALSPLLLLGLIVEAERVRVGLQWPEMPLPAPQRWNDKAYDSLQIRLDLNFDDGLKILGHAKPELCDIALEPGLLAVISRSASFHAEIPFFACIATLLPYRKAEYEQGRPWYAINDAS